MPISKVLILGGGIAGLAAAIALTKHAGTSVEVFEIRDSPPALGGAINLTPNALRCLDYLGVYDKLVSTTCEVPRIDIFALRTGQKLCDLDFDDVASYRFRARRVLRKVLSDALLATLSKCGVQVRYGKRAVSIDNADDHVMLQFKDGTSAIGDMLIGADGIHSFVRTTCIQKERVPEYTGIAAGYSFIDASQISDKLPFESTALYSGRKGSMLLSYHDASRTKLYISAVMETAPPEEDSKNEHWEKEGWKTRSSDADQIGRDVLERMAGCPDPLIEETIKATKDWYLYPVYKLAPRGKWLNNRCILVGDAAHAMPPQGESIGLAIEDVVLLSRLLQGQSDARAIPEIFEQYETLRRDRIEAAFDEANWRWETVKDKGWFQALLIDKLTPWILWFGRKKRAEDLAFDVTKMDLV